MECKLLNKKGQGLEESRPKEEEPRGKIRIRSVTVRHKDEVKIMMFDPPQGKLARCNEHCVPSFIPCLCYLTNKCNKCRTVKSPNPVHLRFVVQIRILLLMPKLKISCRSPEIARKYRKTITMAISI